MKGKILILVLLLSILVNILLGIFFINNKTNFHLKHVLHSSSTPSPSKTSAAKEDTVSSIAAAHAIVAPAAVPETTKAPGSTNSTLATAKQQYNQLSQKVDENMTSLTGTNESLLQKYIDAEKSTATNPYGISLYEPNYVLPAYYTFSPDNAVYGNSTPDNQSIENLEFKAQLSLLVPVWNHVLGRKNTSLDVAYTQLSYWQFYAKSQYFRETDYEPELFLAMNFKKNWLLNLGVVHQSNGQGGTYERSWNRAYANLLFSGQHWVVSLMPWVLIFQAESSDLHNSDIQRYMGNGQALYVFKYGSSEVSLMSRNNAQSLFKRGAEQLTYSYHLVRHFYVYLQGFSGYGQSLIEYNHRTNAVGAGIALNDWF